MKPSSQNFIPIVLCAGLGTRLRPLTYCVPKVVAPLGDAPIAFTSIRRFLDAGFETVHCNTHYLAPFVEAELRAALAAFGYEQSRLRCWYEPELLNSGGGIQRIWEELCCEDAGNQNKDVIVVSGDLYGKLPLEAMMDDWSTRSDQETSLFVTKQLNEDRPDVTWVDMSTRLIKGFGRDYTKDAGFTARNFTGQQIISAECLRKAKRAVVSSIDLYYRAALSRGEVIKHFIFDESFYWYNIGTYQEFLDAMQDESVKGLGLVRADDCLVIAVDQKKTDQANDQSLLTIKFAVNTLRTEPRIGEKSLMGEVIKGLVTANGTREASLVRLNPEALVFQLKTASLGGGLGLAKPLLVPLELCHSEWALSKNLTQNFAPHAQPYQTSQTYLLV